MGEPKINNLIMMNQTQNTKEMNFTIISDLHKDVYGYRPRGKYSDFTNQELEDEIDELSEMLEVQMEREKEQEKKDVEAYKNIIQKTMDYHNIDQKTALRWLLEAEGVVLRSKMDIRGHLYVQGVLFSDYADELFPTFVELMEEQQELLNEEE